tara:strand:+ start:1029 stop:1379 length:351 start_codon:yes stop_codon:yes gene_type:complete
MAVSRYNNRTIIDNNNESYVLSDILKKRGINSIEQFITARLRSPDINEIINLDVKTEIWAVGTKYFKLAKKYYGSEEYWWVIAWYNLKPLETDFKPGDVVYIPTPLQDILSIYGLL